MRKTKEEKIIEHGTSILKELHKVYLEGIGIEEYHKLLNEYKKLYRRYEKTIKLSDNMGGTIMKKNDNLHVNLQYTIKTARNKLLENVTEHRKTKDAADIYKEKINQYKKEINESANKNLKLQKQLNQYIKQFGKINHQFNDEINKDQTIIEINPEEYKNLDIKDLINRELSKDYSCFILTKIRLKDFSNMEDTIEQNSSISNFIKGTYKFIKNSFNKDCIVFHDNLVTFYVISKNLEINEVKSSAAKLGNKRSVYNFKIDFNIGIARCKEKDSVDDLIKKSENAFEESVKCNYIVVK